MAFFQSEADDSRQNQTFTALRKQIFRVSISNSGVSKEMHHIHVKNDQQKRVKRATEKKAANHLSAQDGYDAPLW